MDVLENHIMDFRMRFVLMCNSPDFVDTPMRWGGGLHPFGDPLKTLFNPPQTTLIPLGSCHPQCLVPIEAQGGASGVSPCLVAGGTHECWGGVWGCSPRCTSVPLIRRS